MNRKQFIFTSSVALSSGQTAFCYMTKEGRWCGRHRKTSNH